MHFTYAKLNSSDNTDSFPIQGHVSHFIFHICICTAVDTIDYIEEKDSRNCLSNQTVPKKPEKSRASASKRD